MCHGVAAKYMVAPKAQVVSADAARPAHVTESCGVVTETLEERNRTIAHTAPVEQPRVHHTIHAIVFHQSVMYHTQTRVGNHLGQELERAFVLEHDGSDASVHMRAYRWYNRVRHTGFDELLLRKALHVIS